jgi:hypothetical protein
MILPAQNCWFLFRDKAVYPGINNHTAMPFSTFNVKRGGKQVQAILSASWIQKQLIAHKFTTGWEVGTITKRKPKSKNLNDGEMEWWVKYTCKSETGSRNLDYSHTFSTDHYEDLWLFVRKRHFSGLELQVGMMMSH